MQWLVVGIVLLVLQQFLGPIQASQAAGQETLIGIVGQDFILLGADSSVSQGISLTASNLDKIAPLVEPFPTASNHHHHHHHPQSSLKQQQQQQCIVAAAAGDAATSDRLIGMLQAYATIQEYEAGVGCDVHFVDVAAADEKDGNSPKPFSPKVEPGLTVKGMAYLARSQIASIRPGANVCLLIAGMMWDTPESGGMVQRPSFLSHQVQTQLQQAAASRANTLQQQEQEPTTILDTTLNHTPTTNDIDNDDGDDNNNDTIPRSASLTPHLYWLDELGSLQKIHYGAHGLGSNFCLSVLDQGYHPHLSLEQATQLMRDCFQQLRTRYLVNSPQPPCIKCVDATGIRLIR